MATPIIFCSKYVHVHTYLFFETNEMIDSRANWKQIADTIRLNIKKGELEVGQKLPREEDLALQFSVSRSTIHRALKVLEQEGHIHSRKRAGTFVTHQKRGHKHLIALIFDRVAQHFDFPSSEMIEGIRQTLGDQVGLVLCDSKDSIEREANFLNRMANETDGIICFPIADQRDGIILERAGNLGCPVVVVDRIPAGYTGSAVLSDDRAAINRAIQALVEKGHRQIGFIGFHKTTVSSAMARVEAYREGIAAHLPENDEDNVRWIGLDFETNGELLQTAVNDAIFALTHKERPISAIVCMQDDLGLRVLNAVERLGLSVPDQFGIVTVNEWPPLSLKRPWDLHRIVRKKKQIGIESAKLLQLQISSSKLEPVRIAIPADYLPASPKSAPKLESVQEWIDNKQKQETLT